MTRISIVLAVAAFALLPAAVASAEPDRSATLNAANPKFTWESSGTGVPHFYVGSSRCTGAPFTCEYILFNVKTAGELTLTLDNTDAVDTSDPSVKDIDGRLYRSNAAGEPRGMTLTSGCATGSSSETCKVAVAPGFYLLEVEYFTALEAHYIGTAELVPGPTPPVAETQITLEGCNFTLYYFKDSAERLQARVPPGYRVRPYSPYGPSLAATEGSATIAAAAYDCARIAVPGSSPAPGIFTLLSVLVYPPDKTDETPNVSDFYVLWVHADNPQLVELLASRGMPAHLVPGMVFEKPAQSLAVRVDIPWSQGAYELGATGFGQDLFHPHANSFWHDAAEGWLVRMDFVTVSARDQYCAQRSDHHAVPCGTLTAQAGTPVASFFGASDRSAENAWDHDPLERAEFHLSVSPRSAPGVLSRPRSQ